MFYKVRLPENQTRSSWRKPGRSRIAIITFTATAVLAATMAVINSPFADAATVKKPIKRSGSDSCYVQKAEGWPVGVTVVPGNDSVTLSFWTANSNELRIHRIDGKGGERTEIVPGRNNTTIRQFVIKSAGKRSVLPRETLTFDIATTRRRVVWEQPVLPGGKRGAPVKRVKWGTGPVLKGQITVGVDSRKISSYELNTPDSAYGGVTGVATQCVVAYGTVRAK